MHPSTETPKNYQGLLLHHCKHYEHITNSTILLTVSVECLYRCSRPSAVGCSLGCLLRQGCFPVTLQHTADHPGLQCARKPPPGAPACALCSPGPGSRRCVEEGPPHIPCVPSQPAGGEIRVVFFPLFKLYLNQQKQEAITSTFPTLPVIKDKAAFT